MHRLFEAPDGTQLEVSAQKSGDIGKIVLIQQGQEITREMQVRQAPNGDWLLQENGITRRARISVDRQNVWISSEDSAQDASVTVRMRQVQKRRAGAHVEASVRSPMTGRVVLVHVKEQEIVEKNQPLVVVEAMKMEHVLRAPAAGRVHKVNCQPGQLVEGGAELVEVEPLPSK